MERPDRTFRARTFQNLKYLYRANRPNRSVTKVEELFSELDKAVESLTTAREQLKAYRQAVLQRTDRFTTRFRLGDIAVVSGGLTKHPGRNSQPTKMLYLRVANVHADRIDLDQIAEIGVSEDEFENLQLKKGDLPRG